MPTLGGNLGTGPRPLTAKRKMAGKWPRIPPESMRFATIGIEFISIFTIFLLAGVWLDRRFNIMPLFTLVGMVLGFAGAMYRVVRVAQQFRRDDRSNRSDEE
jgi:F0F1-type ATP synthase assembly protein I